jgi:hypothetical protein
LCAGELGYFSCNTAFDPEMTRHQRTGIKSFRRSAVRNTVLRTDARRAFGFGLHERRGARLSVNPIVLEWAVSPSNTYVQTRIVRRFRIKLPKNPQSIQHLQV